MRRFAISILVVLSSCASPGGENIVLSPSATTTQTLIPSPETSPAHQQETPTSVRVDSATPPNSQIPGPPTTTEVVNASPSPTHSQVLICSPLADHTLEQLKEIVSQPYDPPPPGKDERHHGVDFAYYNHAGRAAIDGEGVQSIIAGRVAATIQDRLPYGNMVIIETAYDDLPLELMETVEIPNDYSIYHLYSHFVESPLVELGQRVECGQLLGHVGQTGYIVPVAHLHLETRIGPPGVSFESMVFFDTQAAPEEQDAYLRWRISGDFQHFDPMIALSSGVEPSP